MSYLEMKGVGRQGPTLGVNLLEVALAGMPRGPMVCVEWHKESRQRSSSSTQSAVQHRPRCVRCLPRLDIVSVRHLPTTANSAR